MRRLSVVLLSMMLVGLFGQGVAAQEAVGRVQVFETGQPAADARVVLFDLEDLNRSFAGFTDADGQFRIVLDGRGASGGGGFRLLQNFPNPFNPGTTIPYELAQAGAVRLEVYNILGQQVRVLVDEAQGVGRYTAQWDARDGQGRGVAAGLYLYRLTVDGISDTRQMVLLDGASSVPGGGGGFPSGVPEPIPGPARVYGVSISGAGIETYVQADVRVGQGTAPFLFSVQQANPSAPKQAVGQRILGDVNNDGRVNILDAFIVATYGLDNTITIPNNWDITLGDVNNDVGVNISDALILAKYSIDPHNPSLPPGIGQVVAPLTFSLSGRVTSGGTGLSGVTVTLTGTASRTTTTDDSGNYTFADLPNGTYTLRTVKEGYGFSPGSETFVLSGRNETGVDFTGTAMRYSISGRVIEGNAGLRGVTITLSGSVSTKGFQRVVVATPVAPEGRTGRVGVATPVAPEGGTRTEATGVTINETVLTDNNGSYAFSDLPNGSYTLRPSLDGYAFSPQERAITVDGKDVVAQDIAAAPLPAHRVTVASFSLNREKVGRGTEISSQGNVLGSGSGEVRYLWIVQKQNAGVTGSDTMSVQMENGVAQIPSYNAQVQEIEK